MIRVSEPRPHWGLNEWVLHRTYFLPGAISASDAVLVINTLLVSGEAVYITSKAEEVMRNASQ